MADFDKAHSQGWERSPAGTWSRLSGSKYMEVNARGSGRYSATVNGVRIKNRVGFDEAILLCEQAPQPIESPTSPEFDTEGLVANTIKKILVERYPYAHEIDGILSSGSLEDVLVSFYNFARAE